MIVTAQKTVYLAFGMRITSDIALPELNRCGEPNERVDVEVTVGDLAEAWDEGRSADHPFYAAVNDGLLFYIPDTAIFKIQGGNRIVVSPMPGSDGDKVRLYLLGTCMGALLYQRQMLPLHGSAVVIDGKAYAFVGESGAGKSTLAAAFLSQGYRLLSDDVIAVDFPGGAPIVRPAYPQQKLWQESIDGLGMESKHYAPLFERQTKFAVPVRASFHAETVPLGGVFELMKPEGERFEMEPVLRLGQFPVLLNHTYRNPFIALFKMEQWHFEASAAIVKHTKMFRLRRPTVGFTAHEMASRIVRLIGKEGAMHDDGAIDGTKRR